MALACVCALVSLCLCLCLCLCLALPLAIGRVIEQGGVHRLVGGIKAGGGSFRAHSFRNSARSALLSSTR
eukprot:68335-Alexandrium_andersonii.AAC.1